MSVKKRVIIGLIMTFIGLCIDKMQLTIGSKPDKCTPVIKEYNTYEQYDILAGDIRITTSGTYYITGKGITTSHNITVENAVKDVEIILDNVNIDTSKRRCMSGIDIDGEAAITLLGENNIVSPNTQTGIAIGKQGRLTITEASTGRLNVKGGIFAPAIGARMKTCGGKLYINGGTINAYGQGQSAAIGTGNGDSPEHSMQCIVINGGNIYCEAEAEAAAIGGGRGNNVKNIQINGGHIVAKAGRITNAIGGGYKNSISDCKVEINGGTLVLYQGNHRIAGEKYAQPIQLNENTTIKDEAIVIAIGHINESEEDKIFEVVDINELGKVITLSITQLGIKEQIDLEGKEKILNLHLPKGSYYIKLQGDEKDIEAQIGEAPIYTPITTPILQEIITSSNIQDNHIIPEVQEVQKEDSTILQDEVEGLEENIEVPKEEIKVLEESIEVPKEEVKVPEESVEISQKEVEAPKENIQISTEEVKNYNKNPHISLENIEASVENSISSQESIENHETINNRIKIDSTPTFQRLSWKDINCFRTTLGCYISYGIKFNEKPANEF